MDQNNVEMIYMEKNIHCCTYTCIHCPGLQAYHQYDVSLRPAWKLQKGCTRLAAASDKVYQLLAQGRWFSLDTPTSSITKTGRHDIAEILLKVALNTKIQKFKFIVLVQIGEKED